MKTSKLVVLGFAFILLNAIFASAEVTSGQGTIGRHIMCGTMPTFGDPLAANFWIESNKMCQKAYVSSTLCLTNCYKAVKQIATTKGRNVQKVIKSGCSTLTVDALTGLKGQDCLTGAQKKCSEANNGNSFCAYKCFRGVRANCLFRGMK